MTGNPSPRRGAALIYVMLIFALAAVIAAGLLSQEQLEVIRTQRFLDEEQATHYAYGAEIYARQLLFDDMTNHGDVDYIGEAWSGKQSVFTVQDGIVEMDIEDLRGRFNINSLLSGDQRAIDDFTNLCTHLGVTSAGGVLLHFNQLTTSGPAATPQAWLVDPSELMDYGLSAQDYRLLAPYLAALPTKSYAININTASDAVLAAYLPANAPLSNIHDMLRQYGYITQDRFGALGIFDGTIGVTSDFFLMHATVSLHGHITRLDSVLYRDKDEKNLGVAAIARKWGG